MNTVFLFNATSRKYLQTIIGILMLMMCTSSICQSQILMTGNGSNTQDFNSLITVDSVVWVDNSTIPNWYSQRTGTGTIMKPSTGSSNAGGLYSFGTTASSDRSIGSIGSGNAVAGAFAHGVQLKNTSGGNVTDLKVSYTLEQWRAAATTANAILCYYKTSAVRIDSLNPPNFAANVNTPNGWIAITGLTLSTPVLSTAGTLDGNAAANRVSVANFSIPGLTLANNEFLMLKWDDSNHIGSDHGIGIDDVNLTWTVSSATTPVLNATTITNFANTCVGSVAGPNSFTVSGTDLNTNAITVGPLAGYTFSLTSGGTYTNTVNIPQSGGVLTATTIYVKFSPTAAQSYNGNIPVTGGGASTINVAVVGTGLAPTVPSFTQISAICSGGTFTLPSTSNNGINGSWTPAINNTATTTYTFTPSSGTCVTTATMTVTVNAPGVVPTFTQVAPICNGASFSLPTTSNNNITGTWSPAINNTATTTYTFTPAIGQCAVNATMTVVVNATTTTTFTQVSPICSGGSFTLPTTSNNAVTGIWTPAINNTSTTTYTFTPSAGQCATTYNMTVTVNNNITPAFTQVAPILTGGSFTLPTTSNNGVTGTWTPAINNTTTTTYTFTPTAGQCATTATMTVVVNIPIPSLSSTTNLLDFDTTCVNVTVGPLSFVLNGNNLSAQNIVIGPFPGYAFSTNSTAGFSNTLTLTQAGGTFSQTIYVNFTPTAAIPYNGNIMIVGGGATQILMPVSGEGVVVTANVITGDSSAVMANAATLSGTIASEGCAILTQYGIEYSGINGFTPGFGMKVPASNLSAGSFSQQINGLVQNTLYYYRAYATDATGTGYGEQKSFFTKAIPAGLVIYSTPIIRGGNVHFSLSGIKPGHYAVRIFNTIGQLVYQKDLILQLDFIDDQFILPAHIPTGLYTFQIFNPTFKIQKSMMVQ